MSIEGNINGIFNTAMAIHEIADATTSTAGSKFSFINNNATTPEVLQLFTLPQVQRIRKRLTHY